VRGRQLGRPRHVCEDNIKMYYKEVGHWAVNWIQLLSVGSSGGLL
jgi:hypothetical protein